MIMRFLGAMTGISVLAERVQNAGLLCLSQVYELETLMSFDNLKDIKDVWQRGGNTSYLKLSKRITSRVFAAHKEKMIQALGQGLELITRPAWFPAKDWELVPPGWWAEMSHLPSLESYCCSIFLTAAQSTASSALVM